MYIFAYMDDTYIYIYTSTFVSRQPYSQNINSKPSVAVCCSALQCVAVCCNVSQFPNPPCSHKSDRLKPRQFKIEHIRVRRQLA